MIQLFKSLKQQMYGKWWFHQHDKNIVESILYITATIAEHAPPFLKRLLIKSFDTIGLSFYRMSNILFSQINSYHLLTATLKETQTPLQVLIKGNPDLFSSVTKHVFSSVTTKKNINRRKAAKWWKHPYQSNTISPDLFIVKSDMFFKKYYQKNGCMILPEYVSFHLDTSKDFNKIFQQVSDDVKKDIDKAQQTGYTYQIRNDRLAFSYFYHHMYYPYMKWKHTTSDRIASYATIRYLAARGAEILFIKHEQSYIFGGMFLEKDNKIETLYAGLMKGKFNHLHNGIMALSYYFLIEISKNRNCHSIDFGTAPPFIQDGLYVYKNKWNMRIKPSSPVFSDIFAMKIIKNNASIEEFIKSHPFHVFQDKKNTTSITKEL